MIDSVGDHCLNETEAASGGAQKGQGMEHPAYQAGKVPSQRFLSKLRLAELWAGVATLSACFNLLSGVPLHAFCECDDMLFAFLSTKHPTAQTARRFEDNEWLSWQFCPDCYSIFCGGPSCTSLSTAGKQLAGRDPTSRYLFDHLKAAAHFAALLVLLENVAWRVDGDEEHGLFSQFKLLAGALGYVLTKVWRLRDCEVSGFTQRERVFLLFEQVHLVPLLPAVADVVDEPGKQRQMSEVLLNAAETPVEAWLDYDSMQLLHPKETLQGQATKVAILSISWHGKTTERGALVALKQVGKSLGGVNKWRVMGRSKGMIELRRADRKQPTFRLIKPHHIAQGLAETISVYSVLGVGIGLRRWGEPPLNNAFAVLKQTASGLQPCIIVPEESWALHGLAAVDRQLLCDLGASPPDIASAAGNCITMAMSRCIVRQVLHRLCQYEDVESQVTTALKLQVPRLSLSSSSRAVLLLPVSLQGVPKCLIAEDNIRVLHVPLFEQGRAHKAASKLAANLARQLFQERLEVILCGHFDNAIAFCVPVSVEFQLPPMLWCASEAAESPSTRLLMSLAITIAFSCVPPPQELKSILDASPANAWCQAQTAMVQQSKYTGAREAMLIQPKLQTYGITESQLQDAYELDRLAGRELRQAIELEAAHTQQDLREGYVAWADAIKPLPRSELPTDLHKDVDMFSDCQLLNATVPDSRPPHTTKWLPRAPPQVAPVGFTPRRISDLLFPWAVAKISNWIMLQLQFLQDISSFGAKAVRQSNKPLALGQDAFQPVARGIVWDLRRLSEGVIVPVDFTTPIESHLNLQLLREELAEWPDQELVNFLLEGMRYKADVGLQIVLLPHLVSLRGGYGSLQAEVDKYEQAGWYGLFSHPPFLPFRLVPKGSVPRKLEPTRPRPTTEAGAPRQVLWGYQGGACHLFE